MAMTYDAFLDQMKKDLEAGFAEDLAIRSSASPRKRSTIDH